jgi:sugar/nucleoside kinase (ribokinase family)
VTAPRVLVCGDVVFAGRAGAADAEFHRAELARFGVEPKITVDQDAATGSIVVLIEPDGERTMITDRGANLRLQPADVAESLLDGADLLQRQESIRLAPPNCMV